MGSVWGVVGSSQTQGQGWSPEDTLTQHIFFTKGKFLPYFWAERRGAGSPPVFAISFLPSAQGNKVTCFGVTCPDRLPPEIRSVFLGKNKFVDEQRSAASLPKRLCIWWLSLEDMLPRRPCPLPPCQPRLLGPAAEWTQRAATPHNVWTWSCDRSSPSAHGRRSPLPTPSSVPKALTPHGER